MGYFKNKERIAGLDGLRGLSVSAVFFHHTGLVSMPGGFVGVDVFFVLSGYLITGILARDYDINGRIGFGNFYWRRTQRLFPALFFFLGAVFLYQRIFKPDLSLADEVLPASLYFMNWVRAFGGPDAVLTGHTWSLSVEQQFYLLWPLVLFLFFSFSRRNALAFILLLLVGSSIWRSYLIADGASFSRIYNGFDTHCDGLLLGSCLALTRASWLINIARLWGIAAVALIVLLFSQAGSSFAATGPGFFVSALATLSIVAKLATAQTAPITRILEWGPLAGLGMVSYGFYLWHYGVIRVMLYEGHTVYGAFFGGLEFPKVAMLLATFGVTLVCTLTSWFFIESPILRAGRNS